jgi:hypothetical protein
LGDDEQAQGKVKIKEMGAKGPDKDGILVDLKNLVEDLQARLQRKAHTTGISEVTTATNELNLETAQFNDDSTKG